MFSLAMSKKKSSYFVIMWLGLVGLAFMINSTANATTALYPDLRTVVPTHIQLVNEHKQEIIRFSNGVANTGDGPWQMRPVFPLDGKSGTQDAIQQILDSNGNVVLEELVSQFQYHETHNHWHIDDVALFTVHSGSPTGPIVGDSVKSTACLIDWYKLDDNAPNTERIYFDCFGEHQGISVGWVDQYHQATEGQQIDITGAPAGLYYLVSKANPENVFLETDYDNNEAWVSFMLSRHSNGNPKIEIMDHSACESPGMCGERSTNR